MSYQILNQHNREELAAALRNGKWVIACLCAGWCGSCREYASAFAAWAERSPQHHFVWIDIEDQADLIGDLDIDDFPTLLIEQAATVSFFGPMEPDTRIAERLLLAQIEKSPEQRILDASSSEQQRAWQTCDLLNRLDNPDNAA
jgi:thioredoxin 1